MAAGNVPNQSTATATEATASVAGGGATTLVDLVQLFSSAVQAYVARQVMVIGDPTNQTGLAGVISTVPSGAETGLVIKIAMSPELQLMLSELRDIRAELQQLNMQLGTLPATPPPVSHTDLNS